MEQQPDKPAYIKAYTGEGKLFEVQPEWCRMPLALKTDDELNINSENEEKVTTRIKRVLFLDPRPLYNREFLRPSYAGGDPVLVRVGDLINPYQRYTSVPMGILMPTPEDKSLCACGCGQQIPKGSGRRRWATDECYDFAQAVWAIIAGVPDLIRKYLAFYYGRCCAECGAKGIEEVDHIHPVALGGGGGWLSNYKPLCVLHHRKKTNSDFGWGIERDKKIEAKTKKEKSQFKLDL